MTNAELLGFGYRGLGGQIEVAPGPDGRWRFEAPANEPEQAAAFWREQIFSLSDEEKYQVYSVLQKNRPRAS